MNTRQPTAIPSMLNRLRLAFRARPFGIYKHRDFHALLERERALSDRHNRMFSLAEFSLADCNPDLYVTRALMDALVRRLRKSDIAGWIGPWRVGVILPDTPAAGAWILVERICAEVSESMPRPACRVCTYPADDGSAGQAEPVEGAASCQKGQEQVAKGAPSPLAVDDGLIEGILFGPPPGWKRGLDILGGGLAILALSPFMLLVALTIKLVSKGPILFRQERVGYLGKSFVCWKFRTMRVDADVQIHKKHFQSLMEKDTPMTKLDVKNDPRLIPLGRYLRAAGLDELPQLFNVLLGDMSLVGPRPCIRYEYEGYQRWQKTRCDTLPGLTGLWQTSGKNKTTFTEMMRLDIAYSRRKSLWFDLVMLVKTVPAILGEIRNTIRSNRRSTCKTCSTSES